MTEVPFLALEGSLAEARAPFALAGLVLFLVTFTGGYVGAGWTNPVKKG